MFSIIRKNHQIILFSLVFVLLFGTGSQCFAWHIPNPIKCEDIPCVIYTVADLIFYIALAIVPLMIIIGGIMFLIAAGDPQKVNKAKSLLFWSVVGLSILLLAQAIAAVVESIIGGRS